MMRHLVIIAHPDDELVFMSPDMLHILRGAEPVKIVYLTAGDAGKGETYYRAREASIAQTHALQRPSGEALARVFLRLPDGMLQGEGSQLGGGKSLLKLWRGDIGAIGALDGTTAYSREALTDLLHGIILGFEPTLLHTLNGLEYIPGEHADHYATGAFAAAACARLKSPVTVRSYIGSNSPGMPANVVGAALSDKLAVFEAYARNDAEIFNGRPDWLRASIFAPMLERQYYTVCESDDPRLVRAATPPGG